MTDDEIMAAIEADPKLQEGVLKLIEDPRLQRIIHTLATHPELRQHVAALLAVTRAEEVGLQRLDAAEACVIDASRNVTNAALQACASNRATNGEERAHAERKQAERKKVPQKDKRKGSTRGQGKSR